MSHRLTLSEDLTDRLCAQADHAGHATVEALLTSLLDEIEPPDAAELRRLRRERTRERDEALAAATAAGYEDWPEVGEPRTAGPNPAGAGSVRESAGARAAA